MMTNVEAFERLQETIDAHGVDCAADQLYYANRQDSRVVARALEASEELPTKRWRQMNVDGLVAVRAAMAVDGVPEPFGMESEGAKYMIQAQLKLQVPQDSRSVPAGEHRTLVAYLLEPDDPAKLDRYYSPDIPKPPLSSMIELEPPTVRHTRYMHFAPDRKPPLWEVSVGRKLLVRRFLNVGPEGDATAMIPVDRLGPVGPFELARTIGWLLSKHRVA